MRLTATLTCLLAIGPIGCAPEPPGMLSPEVIKITARRFAYDPAVIHLKKGHPYILEVTSVDALHGFNLVEFGIRSDLKPGVTARFDLTPAKPGRFIFHCDIFCGTGHDEMSGEIVVSE